MHDETSAGDDRAFDAFLSALADAPGRPVGGLLHAGDRVGDKYVIEDELGRGGFGVVYRARDESLARAVAIKVGTRSTAAAIALAAREARVLAQLNHPNVVTVYEVGEVRGRMYVAMEFVAGGTARAWLAMRARSWQAIVALYASAADGLAAAHALGVVHRDFKPDNVLVGADDRPRVADFGVATAGPRAASDPDGEPTPRGRATVALATGLVGTEAYMAPEQRERFAIDARADQYAFAVAVWEALFGALPGPSLRTEPARGVPRHVVAALARALSPRPDDRWPTIADLARRLRDDPRVRRRRAIVAGALVVATASSLAVALTRTTDDPCAVGRDRLGAAWSDERARAGAEAFAQAGGANAWPAIRARVASYADDWLAASRETCLRGRAGEASALVAARTACLDSARLHFEVVTGELVRGARDVELALLPAIDDCLERGSPAALDALPADPAARLAITMLDRELAVRELAVHRDEPLDDGDVAALVQRAEALAWPPLRVGAHRLASAVAERVNDSPRARAELEQAATLAIASGRDHQAAAALEALVLELVRVGRLAEATRWHAVAAALIHRVGEPAGLAILRERSASALALEGPRPLDALAPARRELELVPATAPTPIAVSDIFLDLANALAAAGRLPEATWYHELARALTIVEVGSHHPALMRIADEGLALALARDDLDAAERAALEVFARTRAAPRSGARMLAGATQDLGVVRARRGDAASALALAVEALAMSAAADPDSASTGLLEHNAALALLMSGQAASARIHSDRAIAILEPRFGETSAKLVDAYLVRGAIARAERRWADSVVALEHAVALADGAGAGDRVNTRDELAVTLLAQGRAREAATRLAEVAALVATPAVEPRYAGEYHQRVAEALEALHDRPAARASATRARAAWASIGDAGAAAVSEVDAWLAAHP